MPFHKKKTHMLLFVNILISFFMILLSSLYYIKYSFYHAFKFLNFLHYLKGWSLCSFFFSNTFKVDQISVVGLIFVYNHIKQDFFPSLCLHYRKNIRKVLISCVIQRSLNSSGSNLCKYVSYLLLSKRTFEF